MVTKLLHRKLEDRSKLEFVFPQGGNASPIYFEMPFYENIMISESKGASLARYHPTGRSNPMHAYLHGKPKRFALTFTLTQPHIHFESTALSINRFMGKSLLESKEYMRKKFLENSAAEGAKTNQPDSKIVVEGPVMKRIQDAIRFFFGVDAGPQEGLGELLPDGTTVDNTTWQNVQSLAVMYWWVNLVRASVMSNARNPMLGPPIVRITHGVLYSNIPCVCLGYSIDIDETAGYELRSLMPRRLVITMELEETRSGLFTEFDPSDILAQDNEAGWEAILDYGTTDPLTNYSNL